MIGRYSTLHNQQEISQLTSGMDFRNPLLRREVFLRFYGFHLKYKAHPGAVYYAIPYLVENLGLDEEQKLWLCFINGCSQNIITTSLILEEFPYPTANISKWFRAHYDKLGWDTDRRYIKNKLEETIQSYIDLLDGSSQVEYFSQFTTDDDPYNNFDVLWDVVLNNFKYFGRLATFSYLEYLRIAGLNIDCSNLFLDDITGSKSHRNGLCKVLGRDDLDWYDALNPNFQGYSPDVIDWLKTEGSLLLGDAKSRFSGQTFGNDVSYFTLESTLCCYKSWHRPNRRYPNVYNDMFFERIRYAENKWRGQKDFGIFWDMRKEYLPQHLRLEDNRKDPGLHKIKQNHYLTTGQVIMMNNEYPEFDNDFNKNYYG